MKRSARFRRGCQGATLVEFLVIAPIVLVLVLGVVQSAFFFIAKCQVNYAVEFAARYAATRNGTMPALKQGLEMGLMSLQAGSGVPGVKDLARRRRAVSVLFLNTIHKPVQYERINPSPECFKDWGNLIPNSNLIFRSRKRGALSGQSIQDCNILKVRLVYGYRPVTPIIRSLLMNTLRALNPFEPLYLIDRIPIEAVAIVHMHSDVKKQ